MNKLEGFYFFKEVLIPTVEWQEYKGQKLNENFLWTVRTAVFSGDDFNLPRLVGVTANEAQAFADSLKQNLNGEGIVIVYPFFIAKVSGTLVVDSEKITLECVLGDLWNLVTYGKPNYSAIFKGENVQTYGDCPINNAEISQLLVYAEKLKRAFREQLAEGKSVYAEWSFAFKTDKTKQPIGEKFTVFYELKTV